MQPIPQLDLITRSIIGFFLPLFRTHRNGRNSPLRPDMHRLVHHFPSQTVNTSLERHIRLPFDEMHNPTAAITTEETLLFPAFERGPCVAFEVSLYRWRELHGWEHE